MTAVGFFPGSGEPAEEDAGCLLGGGWLLLVGIALLLTALLLAPPLLVSASRFDSAASAAARSASGRSRLASYSVRVRKAESRKLDGSAISAAPSVVCRVPQSSRRSQSCSRGGAAGEAPKDGRPETLVIKRARRHVYTSKHSRRDCIRKARMGPIVACQGSGRSETTGVLDGLHSSS